MAREYKLNLVDQGIALQFEIVGPGVQGNPMGLTKNEIRVFTAHQIRRGRLAAIALIDLCDQHNLPIAKIIDHGRGTRTQDQLRKMAEIKYQNGSHGEGIVIRAIDSAWSFKVINLLYKD